MYCVNTHCSPCVTCDKLLQVANTVCVEGYCLLHKAFNIVSPTVKYRAEQARRMLLQMPLVCIRIGDPSSGKSFSVLLEKIHGADFAKLGTLINSLALSLKGANPMVMERSCVKMLLNLAQSDRERQCIRYAVFKASGITPTQARRIYGFDSISQSASKVDEAIHDAQKIREAIQDISAIQDEALLMQFGLVKQEGSSSSEDELECESCGEDNLFDDCQPSRSLEGDFDLSEDYVREVLNQSDYNWFEVSNVLENKFPNTDVCNKVLSLIPKLELKERELSLITQSCQALTTADTANYESERIANMVNGDVVTDSESDDPENYIGITDPISNNAVTIIAKQRAINKRRKQRLQAKCIAEENFLSRKVSKKVSRILRECPDIGKIIEKYVENHSVGADSWRRTGVLTFDGNSNLQQKVTFKRIQDHLQSVYHRKISFGSVVQLCVARNKRRRSAKHYMGVAKVTTRRARKGFNIKYNPDSHWSGAFYKGLNDIEYNDGRYITIINRDDASGYRLDTLTTHKQHPTPVVQGKDILTTRTDYVNRYSATLQTTSYNFTATNTTSETCVKAAPLHLKNPSQHSTDLKMLESKEELQHVFFAETGVHKLIDCVRVDGAADEGPSHEEVQYYWTERHIHSRKVATLVTTRSSGSSYLNRVELQNGCLALGHPNTYIPSTLAGSCLDPQSGMISEHKLKQNLSVAIDAYISRVNGCPCGDTTIHLYRGAESGNSQAKREKLLVFLKGSKREKEGLKHNNPELFKEFQEVWNVRNNHLVTGLLSQYVFFLLCCYQKGCSHGLCQAGKPNEPVTWYPGGPSVQYLPFPVLDPDRPWGNPQCSSCKGSCAGHYKTLLVDVTLPGEKMKIVQPPSITLKGLLPKIICGTLSVQEAAKAVYLPEDDCKLWLDHLKTVTENRKRGAKKAATTRSKRKKKCESSTGATSSSHTDVGQDPEFSTFCGTCGEEFEELSDVAEVWIGCDIFVKSGTIVLVKGYMYLQLKIVMFVTDVNIKCADVIIIFGNYTNIIHFINS